MLEQYDIGYSFGVDFNHHYFVAAIVVDVWAGIEARFRIKSSQFPALKFYENPCLLLWVVGAMEVLLCGYFGFCRLPFIVFKVIFACGMSMHRLMMGKSFVRLEMLYKLFYMSRLLFLLVFFSTSWEEWIVLVLMLSDELLQCLWWVFFEFVDRWSIFLVF